VPTGMIHHTACSSETSKHMKSSTWCKNLKDYQYFKKHLKL